MPSAAFHTWQTSSRQILNQVDAIHRIARRTGTQRAATAQRVKEAYVILLSSHFQLFCRALHSEAVAILTQETTHPSVRSLVVTRMTEGRKLDSGNPNPGNIGADFRSLGLQIWSSVYSRDARNRLRNAELENLNSWRNAIAHHDFGASALNGRTGVTFREIRLWRATCDRLAVEFDAVVGVYSAGILGKPPW